MALAVPVRDAAPTDRLAALCASPWLDRAIAALACLPFARSVAHEMRTFGFNPAWIVGNANFVLLVLAMIVRRPPSRITPKPLYWVLAFVATYWLFLVGRYSDRGAALVPAWLVLALSCIGGGVCIWARASLNRSIGLVPADRGLVTTGCYRYMRHPIYTGIFFAYLSLALQNFSQKNAAIFAIGAGLFVIKSFVEEDFLRRDPVYAAYMADVPWRWFPYVV